MSRHPTSKQPKEKRKCVLVFVVVFAFCILGSNCNFPGSEGKVNEVQQVITSTTFQEVEEGETNISSERKMLLYAAKKIDLWSIDEVKNEVINLAQQSDLIYEEVTLLEDEDIRDNVSLVFIFEDDPGIDDFASRFPDVQFIGVGISSISPSDNVNVLRNEGLRSDQQSFVAGYIAAMIADDWRAGVVVIGDGEESNAIETGFLNGARYFCGLCQPAFPPFNEYPQSYNLDSGGQGWGSIVESLRANKVSVIYLAPTGEFESNLSQWIQNDSLVIGDGPRPAIIPEEQWVATIQYSAVESFQSIWNELLAGNGGFEIKWNLQIIDVNREFLSVGREREALELIEEFEAGFVDSGYEPSDT